MRYVEKYCRAGHAIYNNMADAHCTLGKFMAMDTYTQNIQQLLREQASIFRCTNVACLVANSHC
jgi:hypothetical protein